MQSLFLSLIVIIRFKFYDIPAEMVYVHGVLYFGGSELTLYIVYSRK